LIRNIFPRSLRSARFRTALTVFYCLLVVAAQTSAQTVFESRPLPAHAIAPLFDALPSGLPPLVLMTYQVDEVQEWARQYTEWQKWADRWYNKRQPGFWDYALERPGKPDPPVWLDELCTLLSDDPRLVRPCALLASWRLDPVEAVNRQAAAATALPQPEAPVEKSVWWRHLHVDGMWSTAQSNVSALGLFGAHVTIEVEGRFQIFAAPGIMLVSLPSFYGTREITPATDYGVTYRLFNAGRSTVHFNLVRAWVLANRASLIDPNITLAGFSVSFRPRP